MIDSRNRDRGPEIDTLGVYQPCARPEPHITIDKRKALAWLIKGAQPSATVRTVLSNHGIMAAYAAGQKPEDLPAEESVAEAPVTEEPVVEAPAPEVAPEETGAEA